MHHVSEISLVNFRSFVEDTIKLSPYTALVGYNNAGKSNFMDAVKWILRASTLSQNDFNDVTSPIFVTATVKGIDEEVLEGLGDTHRPRVEPFVQGQTIKIMRKQDRPSVRDARLFVWDHAAQDWKPNPTGLDTAIKAAFPEPIVVGAMENAAEDAAKFAKSSTIGRILSDILEPLRQEQEEEVASAFRSIERILSAEGDAKARELRALDNRIGPELSKLFPGLEAKVHIDSPSLDNLIKGGTIKVTEQGYGGAAGKDITCLGHGAQRSVQMALLKVLSETRRENVVGAGTTLLMIDEPELYLHPQAIEYVRAALKVLSRDGYQVVFSTHSPQMITREDAADVVLMRKTVDRGSHTRKGLREAVIDAVEQADHQSGVLFSLTNSSKFLFSERVLLAEGKTERYVLPQVFETLTARTLEEAKIAFIELGGVDNVPNAMAVLQAMDLETKSIVDMDFAFRGAVSTGLLAERDPDLAICLAAFRELSVQHGFNLGQNGLPEKGNGFTAAQAVEKLVTDANAVVALDSLHEKLKAKNIWMWKLGSIEKHLGLPDKKPISWSRLAVRLRQERPEDVIPDIDGVRALCNWITTD